MVGGNPHVHSAFLWAERLSRDAIPFGASTEFDGVENALEAYRQIVRRYGPLDQAKVGIGDCLFRLGHYREAAGAYPANRRSKVAAALQSARWAETSKKFSGGRRVAMVSPIPGSPDRWIALFADGWRKPPLNPGDSWDPAMFKRVGVRIIECRRGSVRAIGHETGLLGEPCRKVGVYVVNSSKGGQPLVVAYREFFGGDSDPNAQEVCRITSDGLRTIQRFTGAESVRIVPPSAHHNLRFLVTATWKVWWQDVYEWSGRGFDFANRKSPEFYPRKYSVAHISESKYEYSAWLELASLHMINNRPAEALRALRSADWTCRMSLRWKNRPSPFYNAGWRGDEMETLKEIRHRIGWIQRRDYRHALLYRPYDWDLQVPPYRLGKALSEK